MFIEENSAALIECQDDLQRFMTIANLQVCAYTLSLFLQLWHRDSQFSLVSSLCDSQGWCSSQGDFDVFLTPDELDDPKVCKLLEEQVCKAYESTKGMKHFASSNHAEDVAKPSQEPGVKNKSPVSSLSGTASFTEAGLGRLVRRMGLTEPELWAGMAHRALEAGKVEKALKVLRSGSALSKAHISFDEKKNGCVIIL